MFVLPDRGETVHSFGFDAGANVALGIGLGVDLNTVRLAHGAASHEQRSGIAAALATGLMGGSPKPPKK